nr:MAG TPA: hypothetical protein [Caudoviricetes sp.]
MPKIPYNCVKFLVLFFWNTYSSFLSPRFYLSLSSASSGRGTG